MSNAYAPPPEGEGRSVATAPSPIDYDQLPETGVRRVLRAYDERARQWTRWGAVFAGLFVTLGSSILLSMLGLALGVSSVNPFGANPLADLGIGTAIWWGVQTIITVFLGAYAAAKLGGSVRRSDGVVSGVLTWAVSIVAMLWLIGNLASLALMSAVGAANAAATATTNAPGAVPTRPGAPAVPGARPGIPAPAAPAPSQIEAARTATAGTLWYTFAVTALSLAAAAAGGAAGSVGRLTPYDRGDYGRPRRDWARPMEERDRAVG